MHRHDVHVDPIEAQEVVRLAAERQSAVQESGPTVNGLAEALGLPREEVERLLAEVRGQRGVGAVAGRHRMFGDRSAALSAALALALFLVSAGFGLFLYNARNAPPAIVATTVGHFDVPDKMAEVTEGALMPPVLVPSAPVAPSPDVIGIESEEERKRREIAELAAEIARINADRAVADAERSAANLDRTLNRLRSQLDKLKQDKLSSGE